MLATESADVPAAELVTEYSSGSFRDFVREAAAAPAAPAPRTAAEPALAGPDNGDRDRDGASTLTDLNAADVGFGRKRRSSGLIAVLGVAVIAVAVGGFMLLHHRSGQQAQASASTAHGAATASPRRAPADHPPKWSVPTPLDQQAAQIGNPTITGVSCPQRAMCYAVDSVGAIMSSTAGGSWQTVSTDSQSGFVAISCASAAFCLALDSGGGAITLNQGSWSSPVYVDSRVGVFTAASCPTSTFCMAVDSGGSAFGYTGSPAGWQPFTVDPGGTGLASVSCTSATNCVAVGQGGDVFTYDGSSWSAGQAVDNGRAFAAVSCASPAFCVAVDRSGNAAVFAGGKWTVSPMGAVGDAIDCPTSGYCVAVDSSGGALVYRDGSWSSVTNIDGTNAVQAVSCPEVAVCTATDSMGNVIYYSSPAAAS